MIILIIMYVDVFNILLLVFQKKKKETNMSRFKVDQLRQYFSSL